jgi:hypothetical protein
LCIYFYHLPIMCSLKQNNPLFHSNFLEKKKQLSVQNTIACGCMFIVNWTVAFFSEKENMSQKRRKNGPLVITLVTWLIW